MARNIPSNEKQRPATKTTLPSKISFKMEGKIRSFPEKEYSKNTSPTNPHARYAKRTALKKVRKKSERGTQVQKNGNE